VQSIEDDIGPTRMADDFRSVISALWAKLELGEPTFGPSAAVTLVVDGLDVTLSESPDGRHVIVSGIAGQLSPDPRARGEQVRQLLRANLGFLQGNRAGVSLDSTDDAAPVRVQAVSPCAVGRLEELTGLIEDVLYRLEIHSGDLVRGRTASARPPIGHPAFTSLSHEDFIFRP
jgi:hypothetical protein